MNYGPDAPAAPHGLGKASLESWQEVRSVGADICVGTLSTIRWCLGLVSADAMGNSLINWESSLCKLCPHEALTDGGRIGVHSQPVGSTNLVQDPDPVAGPKSFWIRNSEKKGVLGLNPCPQSAHRPPSLGLEG